MRVDEAGLYRLQQALDGNRDQAERVREAFAAALTAVESLSASLNDLPLALSAEWRFPESVTVRVGADLSEAEAAAADFVARLSALRPAIRADASGITSAVSGAVSRARSLVSGLNLPIRFTATVSAPDPSPDASAVVPGADGAAAAPALARLFAAPSVPDAAALRAGLAASVSAVTNNQVTALREVSAPVNITVTSTGPSAEAVGRTVYNAAERALVRALEGVFA